jgi:hypothetical protein
MRAETQTVGLHLLLPFSEEEYGAGVLLFRARRCCAGVFPRYRRQLSEPMVDQTIWSGDTTQRLVRDELEPRQGRCGSSSPWR